MVESAVSCASHAPSISVHARGVVSGGGRNRKWDSAHRHHRGAAAAARLSTYATSKNHAEWIGTSSLSSKPAICIPGRGQSSQERLYV